MIVTIFTSGYIIRIIQSSITGEAELPEFNSWIEMFVDGFRYLIISFIYFIPAFLILLFAIIFYGSVLINIITGISTIDTSMLLNFGIFIIIACIYVVIIIPILLMAVANMANHNKFTASSDSVKYLTELDI